MDIRGYWCNFSYCDDLPEQMVCEQTLWPTCKEAQRTSPTNRRNCLKMQTTSIEPVKIRRIKGFKKRYELTVDSKQMVLDFPSRYKLNAVISIGANTYAIKRTGWWKRFINIEANQSPFTKWNVQQSWRGSEEFRTENNRVYRLKKAGVFTNKWHWLNESGEPVIEFKEHPWSFNQRASAFFYTSVDETALWLVAVGWFMIICKQQDAAAAAAVS
jgi:hypothetical protein